MLARPFRLVKEKDFVLTLRKGRGWKTLAGQVKILPNRLSNNRFGIVISNKVAKRATVRNRLKRQLRAAVRQINPDLKAGFDVVILAQKPLLEKTFLQLHDFLREAFSKLGLITVLK